MNQEVGLPAHDPANVTSVNPLDDVQVKTAVSALGTCHNGQILLLGQGRGGNNRTHAHWVHSHGLLYEAVFACLHCGL